MAGSRTPSPKTSASELVARFLGAGACPSAVSVRLADLGHLAYSHANQAVLRPRKQEKQVHSRKQRINSEKKVEELTLQTSLQSDKQSAYDLEKKLLQEEQANEEKQKKMDETEIKMRQFQDYLRREALKMFKYQAMIQN